MDKTSKTSSDPWVWISILGFFIALTIFSLNFFDKREKKLGREAGPLSSVHHAAVQQQFSVVLVQ